MVDAILRTHLIDPALLRADDFDSFFTDREARLAALASEAMGKAVVGSEVPQEGIADDGLGLDEEETLQEVA
jgi:hypothetical protein